ncbi:hypothetical protein ACFVGY_22975 [Streptomyces sp. NPDC127106]|uniref:hypothetical protein n=1 Tax=Streptomyces sp. NPDC127106 TaxID=3345360 RepID=UPI00362B823B
MNSGFLFRLLSRPARGYRTSRDRVRRLAAWAARRRRMAAHQFVRGASYGAGTTVITLAAWWFRARYGG